MAFLKSRSVSAAVVGLTVLMGAVAQADFRDNPHPGTPAGIWPIIEFVPAGDFKDFTETISQNRDQVRRMLWSEYGSLLGPMVQPGVDAVGLAQVLANVLITFDGMHDVHKQQAAQGIATSLENLFKAEFDSLYDELGVGDSKRQAAFMRGAELPAALHQANTASKKIPDALARKLQDQVTFFMYGSFTILDRGQVALTVTLEKYLDGQSRTFVARGSIDDAVQVLARKLFDFFQSNRYPDWMNPQPKLEWLSGPKGQATVSAAAARLYCRGQNARLPFAQELVLATQGTHYQLGGIQSMQEGEIYALADRRYYDQPYYYFAGQEQSGGGPVRTDAGYGPIKAKVWCVRGEASEEVRFVDGLFRLYRKTTDREIKTAVEYILNQIEEFGADPEYRNSFSDLNSALEKLESKGVKVTVPRQLRAGL